jgi:hypothetical protein
MDYVINHLAVTLDSLSVKDIYKDREDNVCKIPNLIKEYRKTGMTIWGFDIIKGLDG